ncbi:hypothetical protein [Megasphaera vaginalis (ex Srinivasan et al. 2021)]|nr:hypothetical protein [Megasphaera vaginalis (ex Srinivasan et al. 2021)]
MWYFIGGVIIGANIGIVAAAVLAARRRKDLEPRIRELEKEGE